MVKDIVSVGQAINGYGWQKGRQKAEKVLCRTYAKENYDIVIVRVEEGLCEDKGTKV